MCFVCASSASSASSSSRHIEYYGNQANKLESFSVAAGSANKYTLNYSAAAGQKGQYTDTILSEAFWVKSAGTPVTISYSFSINSIWDKSVVYGKNASDFNAVQKKATLGIFEAISSFANINFVEASNPSSAQLYFYMGMQYDTGSYGDAAGLAAYLYDWNYTRTITAVGIGDKYADFTPGKWGYTTLLHEIGHALGLKHSGQYYSHETGPFLPDSLDNSGTTVMTYNSTMNNTSYAWLDIEALQYIYGAQSGGGQATGDGNDNYVISGAAELVYGGLGNDTIYGGPGNDTIYGGRAQADTLDSADLIYGGQGNDLIFSNSGNDTVHGDAGNDTIYGGLGNDSIYGGDGDDSLAGGGGIEHPVDQSDYISGGNGNDVIVSNGGDDTVYGDAGNDTIYGGLGDDNIYGGDGDDWIFGQDGDDYLVGGAGADVFTFNTNHGEDVIGDFDVSVDKIRLVSNLNGSGITSVSDIFSRVHTYSDGWGSSIDLGSDNYLHLYGVNGASLAASNFEII